VVELGFNLRGIIHYGLEPKVDRIVHSLPAQIEESLDAVKDCHGTIVRAWVGHTRLSPDETAGRLGAFLDKAHHRGIKVIPTLLDYYWPAEASWFTLGSLEHLYSVEFDQNEDGVVELFLLDPKFFANEHKGAFREFVATVVQANARHPALYAWEPGNELQARAQFGPFMQDVVKTIRQHDQQTPIAAGVLHADHALSLPPEVAAETLYSQLPDVKYVTVHYYPDEHPLAPVLADVKWAAARKPERVPIVEELGIVGEGDRLGTLRQQWHFWSEQGAEAILIWNFTFKRNGEDEGVLVGSPEFDKFCDLYRSLV
jgi:hypothetical protein